MFLCCAAVYYSMRQPDALLRNWQPSQAQINILLEQLTDFTAQQLNLPSMQAYQRNVMRPLGIFVSSKSLVLRLTCLAYLQIFASCRMIQ